MVTRTVDITTMKWIKDNLLSQLEPDTEIILTENGQAVARLVSVAKLSRKQLTGLHRDAMTMHPDFDDPMPESFWLGDE